MPFSPTEFLSPPQTLVLAPGEIHVWRADLDASSASLDEFRGCLSADERERAKSFYFQKHRDHYAIARGILRKLLSRYLGKPASDFVFSYNAFGKPSITDHLHFNLSHSHALAVYAFSLEHELGVDVEKTRPELAGPEIADRFFSRVEAEAVKAQGPDAFFRCWTRKEAFVKAHGKGLSLELSKFAVDIGENARLLATEFDPAEAERWRLYSIQPGPGYEGALAAKGTKHKVSFWEWRP